MILSLNDNIGETTDIYDLFVEVGMFKKHDALFEKYNFEPSGHGWAELITVYLKEEEPELLKFISFDCNGDEFFAKAISEEYQINLTRYFLVLCSDSNQLERMLKTVSIT